ncbi:MAG TPA: lysine--tRNA ligase, partial [Patescibacteria group bacterium]|nr:lysine--tRNA ligase [Patescibacteria group bacterium]
MPFEPLDQYLQRQRKLDEIRALGEDPYPHRFERTHTIAQIGEKFGASGAAQLEAEPVAVRLAGRILSIRLHGKAGFAHLGGQGERLQIYVKLDAVGERAFELFRLLDLGDIVGVGGHLFRTKTGELTVWVEGLTLLTKSLLPLPEKWHGLADVEMRYRRRYLDLLANPDVRKIFERRAAIVRELRGFFDERGYLEVETPMMQTLAGGATARPFVTHHNTFDLDLYLRIAPELYLKRLVVGGLDRVYEINRNFRNEGVDTTHQPEFTMLEFYQAYSDYNELMDLTEQMFRQVAERAYGSTKIVYGGKEIDFGKPFERLTMRQAVRRFWPKADAGEPPREEDLRPGGDLGSFLEGALAVLRDRHDRAPLGSEDRQRLGVSIGTFSLIHRGLAERHDPPGKIVAEIFEAVAEPHLVQPTFICDFPAEISPLSKCRADDPTIAERFELFIDGMELANGFSELNDPGEQEARFRAQVEQG